MSKVRFTKKDFDSFYPTDDICLEKIFQLKYKNAINCHKCNKKFSY